VDNPFLVTADRSVASLTDPQAIFASTQAVTAALAETLAALTPPDGLPAMREAYVRGELGLPASPKSPRARKMTIDGPAGPIALRIFVPDQVRGVYLHVHGGGWIVGSNDTWDEQLEYSAMRRGWSRSALIIVLPPSILHPRPSRIVSP